MKFFSLLFESAKIWMHYDMKSYAAAFSYYAPLAIIPLLVLSISIVGFVYGEDFTTRVLASWGTILGQDLLELIRIAINNLETETRSFSMPFIGIAFFLLTSIFTLNVLSVGFHKLWEVDENGFLSWIKRSFRSVLFILIFQIYLILIIGFEFFITMSELRGGFIISLIFLFTNTSIFFSLLFRFLASEAPSWQGCVVGASISAVLFVFTKSPISFYINNIFGSDLYGTAGLILILLIWVYVLATIIFYGAAVAHTYDKIKNNR